MAMTNVFGVNSQVLALALARMAESVGNSFLVVVLPLFIASDFVTGGTFGLTEVFITGVVLSVFGFVNSPLQPFTGRLSDRTGRRKIFVLFGLLLIAIAGVGYTFASTVPSRPGQIPTSATTTPATAVASSSTRSRR